MQTYIHLLWIPLGYLFGSFPTSIIAGKVAKGIDIREHGSGNAGATNTVRILGAKWGVGVGVVDLIKGWLPVFLAALAGAPAWLQVLVGVAAVFGHAFPLFSGFRGGKGVATGAGMILALFPLAFLICLTVFALLLVLTGIVSVGSIGAALTLPLAVLFFGGGLEAFAAGDLMEIGIWAFSLLLGLFVIFLHRKNIRRLIRGEERRFDKIRIFRRRSRD
jgi:glycerol-3-phosphate acyltransferase PlsY